MKRYGQIALWIALAGWLTLSGQAAAKGLAEQGVNLPWAGSYDGPFILDGSETPNGTGTFVIRQDEDTITGRLAQETTNSGCIIVSEFTATLTESGFEAVARSLDGVSPETYITATLDSDEEQWYLTGAFTTRGCAAGTVNGQFLLPKLAGSNPPDLTHTYVGGVWNALDASRSAGFLRSRLDGRDFIVDEIGIVTPIGLVTGTARGQLNKLGDRIENLVVRLVVAGSTLILNGELSASSNGGILFGGLQTNPGELIDLKGSLLMRKQ